MAMKRCRISTRFSICNVLRVWLGSAYIVSSRFQAHADGHGDESVLLPVRLAVGSKATPCGVQVRAFELNTSTPLATLDYGFEVAGYPFFDVTSITEAVQIEVKYAEQFEALKGNFSDGPYPYAASLANTYRVETFQINGVGKVTAFLLQGGQRWETIRLITNGSVAFATAGLIPTTRTVDIDNLPGSFTSDSVELNDIWKLGARAASVACVEARSQGTMWEVDETHGAFVRGMRPGITTKGAFFANYTLEFDANIERGGVGWAVAFPVSSPNKGLHLNLVADNQVFDNTNTSLTQPNSIRLAYGYSFVNVTTLDSWNLGTFQVPFTIQDKTWYRVKTVLDGLHLTVSVGGTQIFNFSLTNNYIVQSRSPAGLISSGGSFGFGGWQDQAAYIRNIVVYDIVDRTELYRNSMTNASATEITEEYGVHENTAAVCLDGPKRDRLVWLGDFLHTCRIIAASTSRYDIAKSTLQFLLDWQTPSGLLPYDPPIGYNPLAASDAFARGGGGLLRGVEVYGVILADYQILGLLAFTSYVSRSNDLDFASATWSKWQRQTQWLTNSIGTDGLLSLFGAFLGPSSGGSAINCALVQALNEMADVATAIGHISAASHYRAVAATLASAINERLWNDKLGVYMLDPTDPTNFSVNSMAFCLTSGTANATQATRFISALPALRLGPGYKDSTLINASSPNTNISPNTNGFLLSALLSLASTNTAATSLDLIKSLWMPMLTNSLTSTGASWEYLDLDGNPGLGLYTSLSHPWGGAPTYLLTEWAAGIQAARGAGGFGYRSWIIDPYVGLSMGLKNVSARVPTAFGGALAVRWRVDDGTDTLEVAVTAPRNTSGVFRLRSTIKVLTGNTAYTFSVTLI